MFLLVTLLIQPDVDRLGSADWETRENAEQRLRILGPLACPSLSEVSRTHENAEVRDRANRLLRPWHQFARDFYAARLLFDPLATIDAKSLADDHDLRCRICRIAIENGCLLVQHYWMTVFVEAISDLAANDAAVHASLMRLRNQLQPLK